MSHGFTASLGNVFDNLIATPVKSLLSKLHLISEQKPLEHRIILQGLDAAGKTTILYKWQLGEVVTTIPTIGMNVESIKYEPPKSKTKSNAQFELPSMNFTCWDVGGKDKIRPLWRHYMTDLTGLVFVLDSNDRDRIEEAAEQLRSGVMDAFQSPPRGFRSRTYHAHPKYAKIPPNAPATGGMDAKPLALLIFANKQDVPNAMSGIEACEKLKLGELANTYPLLWKVQECCAITGGGLMEGLHWLAECTVKYESAWAELGVGGSKGDSKEVPSRMKYTGDCWSHYQQCFTESEREAQLATMRNIISDDFHVTEGVIDSVPNTVDVDTGLLLRHSFQKLELSNLARTRLERAMTAVKERLARGFEMKKPREDLTKNGLDITEEHWLDSSVEKRSQLRITAASAAASAATADGVSKISSKTLLRADGDDEAIASMRQAWNEMLEAVVVKFPFVGYTYSVHTENSTKNMSQYKYCELLSNHSSIDAFLYNREMPQQIVKDDITSSPPVNAVCAAHTDAGVLQVVISDGPGLQCKDGESGEWISIPFFPSAGEFSCVVMLGRGVNKLRSGGGEQGGKLFENARPCEHRVVMGGDGDMGDRGDTAFTDSDISGKIGFLHPEDERDELQKSVKKDRIALVMDLYTIPDYCKRY